MSSGIRINREYTAQELEELKQTAIVDKAYMRSLDYIARRPRSEWEIRDYLRRKEYDSPTIDLILNRLSIKGYVGDVKFAESWVNSRKLLKPTSLRRLKQELQQKHVSSEVIEQVLQQEPEEERDTLRELALKKRTQSRYQDQQKLMAYLLRQGFGYGDVKTVLAQLQEEE